jgi:hypothetical protein
MARPAPLVRFPRASPPALPRGPALAFLAWGGLVALAAALPSVGPTCWFRRVTGCPCPTCGGTRAALALLGGDPVGALLHNPLLVTAFVLLGCALLLRLAGGRRIVVRWPLGRAATWALALGALLANWAWVMARHS